MKKLPETLLWFLWVILTAAGGTLGLFLTMVTPMQAFFLIASYTLAAILACAGQWFLLRYLVQMRAGWIATGLLGFITPPVLIMFAAQLENIPGPHNLFAYIGVGIGGLLAGALMGVVQKTALLARYTTRARWWTWATALAWGLGWAIGTAIPGVDPSTSGDPRLLLTGWFTTWAIIGAITGVALLWLLRSPRIDLSAKALQEVEQSSIARQ